MTKPRVHSFPDLFPLTAHPDRQDDSSLEGVTTNVKLLLKLLYDHCDISKEDDGRKPQRVAGMITILDDVKARIEKSQLANKRAAQLPMAKPGLKIKGGTI
ncbi:hypothetical protein J5N97_028327 [Dioscorea zingiberensis]|uniref:Uncharacterized protein n=1 Tax=Dioscorea zingiberensis TaxID=325984 RepID=A0A9D5BZ04_9LILI|nr:hypothetical protein J5N97_028327 [Dioscorea zingiberensis]